jgi:DNA (cytosine-5)-methyltransferase 1
VTPYYYCAANAIDWDLPAPRIGDRAKPLKEKTLRRIQAGLDRFAGQTFLMDIVHSGRYGRHQDMVWPLVAPNRTQIGQATQGLIMPPYLVDTAYDGGDRVQPLSEPAPTQTTRQTLGMVVPPFVVDLRGENAPKGLDEPVSTVCASGNHHGLVMPFLSSYYGTVNNTPVSEAMPTVTATDRHALVLPFIVSYYTRLSGAQAALSGIDEALPTQPTWPVHYLARPGATPAVEACGFRMLQPHEIHRAMAFPENYVVLGNARERVKQLGNAVCPPVMSILLERCIQSLGS